MVHAFFNWSGGKDSALALYKILNNKDIQIHRLLTSVNEATHRISMHGVRNELLIQQVKQLNFPLDLLVLPEMPSMETYETLLLKQLTDYQQQGIDTAVFGDIFLEDLREYREQQLQTIGMKALFPLWKQNTTDLLHEFIDLGFKAIVTAVDSRFLEASFVGRILDESFLKDLPKNVDPCGENGEFHSFVFDGPLFRKAIPFKVGKQIYKEYTATCQNYTDNDTTESIKKTYGFWFCDLLPD